MNGSHSLFLPHQRNRLCSSRISNLLKKQDLFRGTYCWFRFVGNFAADYPVEDSKFGTWDSNVPDERIDLLGKAVIKLGCFGTRNLPAFSQRSQSCYHRMF
jgi:hypothetical protein